MLGMMSKFKSVYSNFDIDGIDGGPPKPHPTPPHPTPPPIKAKSRGKVGR